MFHKILVALDHTEAASSVFEQALDLAINHNTHLLLLHVLSIDDQDAPDTPMLFPSMSYYPGLSATSIAVYQERWESYKQTAKNILATQTEEARLAGISVEALQRQGSPGEVICEVATAQRADLIFLGSRGRNGISEWLLGSVSNYVMHHAPCSVLVSRDSKTSRSNPMPSSLNHQLISNLAGWQ